MRATAPTTATTATRASRYSLLVVFWVKTGVVNVGHDHQEVSDTEPYGQENHLGKQAGPQGAYQVESITQEPNSDEPNGNTFGRLHSPLLNELRHKQDYPACERGGTHEPRHVRPPRGDRVGEGHHLGVAKHGGGKDALIFVFRDIGPVQLQQFESLDLANNDKES